MSDLLSCELLRLQIDACRFKLTNQQNLSAFEPKVRQPFNLSNNQLFNKLIPNSKFSIPDFLFLIIHYSSLIIFTFTFDDSR